MQFVVVSLLLFLLGFAHAELATSPVDTAISTINKAEQLASTMTTTGTRARRSVNLRRLSNEEFNRCQTIAHGVVCETGLQEDLYTLALECQQQEIADVAQFSCGVNDENGLYCSQGLEISQEFGEETSSNCPSLSSCSSSCRNSITRIRDRLGCCSGYWTNLAATRQSNLDGTLWSVCGVSTGELCPIPAYNSTVATSRFCTEAETSQILFSRRCMQNTSGITVETLANTTGCGGVAKIHVETCSINSNGDFCSLQTDLTTVTNMIQNCAQSVVSGTCSSLCRFYMNALRSELGCCINTLYNGTTTRIAPIPGSEQLLRFFTNSFWLRCNVSPPGVCESPLLLPEIRDNGGIKTSGVIGVVLTVALVALFI